MLYAFMFSVALGVLCNFNLIIILLGFISFFASIPGQWVRTSKPNLTSLVPLSQKRKTVYALLSVPAMFVFFVFIMSAVLVAIWLFSGFGTAAIIGDANMIPFMFQIYTQDFNKIFADGYAASLFVTVLVYNIGAGMIYSHTDSKLYRNLTAVALFLAGLIGAEALLQSALKYEIVLTGMRPPVHIAGYAGMYIKEMPLPWLAVLLTALVSLSALGFGIYLVIKKNKTKNY